MQGASYCFFQGIFIRFNSSLIGEKDVHLIKVTDLSDGCGSKFHLLLVSNSFAGESILDRQRRVNEILKEEMKTIHALTMKCWTVEQYEKKKAEGKL